MSATAPKFCHLHVHSQYSLLDGASRIDDLVKRARKNNQPALALTDHGNMFGAIEFYKACKESAKSAEKDGLPPLKPIVGMEAYIVPGGGSRHRREKVDGQSDCHLLLWASNAEGYKNLMKLSTIAYKEGFYGKPRLDRETLAANCKGIIASTGCVGSEIPQAAWKNSYEAACREAATYREIFGKENLYFEIQDHCIASSELPEGTEEMRELAAIQKKTNDAIMRMAREFGGKLICTNDSHYTGRDDARAHDALLCIGTGKLISDEKRLRFACDEFYLKSSDEMERIFGSSVPEALANTLEVAERCDLKIKFGDYHFPVFKVPEGGGSENAYFRAQVEAGLIQRYGLNLPAAVRARADEELRVLEKMGFVGYLLIVWDIIRFAKSQGIPVGPGRGSAAGSLACYALGITDIEPLQYNLIFERFVNEGRNEMPDIDIDFCQSRRGEVINYVQDKYGRDCTANIVTFNAMLAKGAVRDVGRVLNWDLAEVNSIAKLIPAFPGKKVTLKAAPSPRAETDQTTYAIDDEPELATKYKEDEKVRTLIDMARRCEGIARNTGCHAAGLVIADQPVWEYCPLYRDKNGMLLTQYEMQHIDPVGLLKIDFLGLETLTKLQVTCRLIKERRGIDIHLDQLPDRDVKTCKMLGRGDARAIFQFESEGMRQLLKEARPDCIEDLVALNAMYRPGPMANIPSFCARKHGREKFEYMTPLLEPILKSTYGIIVYQEQVMQIANVLAGFSLSEADSLRKAMGKKKKDLMEKYGVQFVEGCGKNNISAQQATDLYELIKKFAEYGFNKSHAAAYALLAYQTAYLKANYPAEFMAGNMSLEQGNTDKIVEYIDEARRMGLDILPPDVNKSGGRFGIENENLLRFSLGAVKGVGDKAVECIVAEREKNGPYADLYNFCERMDSRSVNKGCLESLIRAGAFDSVCKTVDGKKIGRATLMAILEEAMSHGANIRQDKETGQGSLFGDDDDGAGAAPKIRLPQIAEWTDKKRLEEERTVLGFYLSGHPLEEARELVEGLRTSPLKDLRDIPDDYIVMCGAYVAAVQTKITKAKGEKMAVLNLEDFSGSVQAVVFPRTYNQFKDLLTPDRILFVRGKIKADDNGSGNKSQGPQGVEAGTEGPAPDADQRTVSILVEEILTPEDAARKYAANLSITIDESAPGASLAVFQSVAALMKAFPGTVKLYFTLNVTGVGGRSATVTVRAGDSMRIDPRPEMIHTLRGMVNRGAVKVFSDNTRPVKASRPAWQTRKPQPAAAAGN